MCVGAQPGVLLRYFKEMALYKFHYYVKVNIWSLLPEFCPLLLFQLSLILLLSLRRDKNNIHICAWLLFLCG